MILFLIPLYFLALYLIYKSVFSRSISKIRFLGVALILFGCTSMLLTSSTGTYAQQEIKIENPESVEGIENVKGYNESEIVDISNKRTTLVVDPKVEMVEIRDSSGERIESIEVGSGYVNLEDLSRYNRIHVRTINENGDIIDEKVIYLNSSSPVAEYSYF